MLQKLQHPLCSGAPEADLAMISALLHSQSLLLTTGRSHDYSDAGGTICINGNADQS